MKEIKKYMSIERYGKPCTNGVLMPGDLISITEKIDGSNASFRIDEENPLGVSCYSREHLLTEGGLTLNGYWGWVKDNIVPIRGGLNPSYIYFGEWLVKHHVRYKEEYYKNFYMFSIWDTENNQYLSDDIVIFEAERLGLKTVPYIYRGEFISFEHLMGLVGKSDMSYDPDEGEGIVVKNVSYFNQYGRQVFVKLVSQKFAEVQTQKLPKNPNIDIGLRTTLMTVLTKPRLDKLIHKLVDDELLNEDYGTKDMGTILKGLGSRVYEDIMKEEGDLFEEYDEVQIKKMIGKNMPPLIREILKEDGRE